MNQSSQTTNPNFKLENVVFRCELENDYREVELLTKMAFWNKFVQG
jgi:hypothetical protein